MSPGVQPAPIWGPPPGEAAPDDRVAAITHINQQLTHALEQAQHALAREHAYRQGLGQYQEVMEKRLADFSRRNLKLLDEIDQLHAKVEGCCNHDYREECMRLRAETSRQQRIIDDYLNPGNAR